MKQDPSSKQTLRSDLLLQRAGLSLQEQEDKAIKLTNIISKLPIFQKSHTIAGYWPMKGEISALTLIELAYLLQKSCYLPALDPKNKDLLTFVEYKPGDPLIANRFGIMEPDSSRGSIHANELDLVLTPLLAFDKQGRRIGMGLGYYDRSFSFLKKNVGSPQPFLLGLAYEWQEVETLPEDEWDIRLSGIATEKRFMEFKDLNGG